MDETPGLGVLAAKLFPLLFNMMGPIGVIPAFAATAGFSAEEHRMMANRAALFADRAETEKFF